MKVCASESIILCQVKHSFVKVFEANRFFMFYVEDTREMACTFIRFDILCLKSLVGLFKEHPGYAASEIFCDEGVRTEPVMSTFLTQCWTVT